jgi:hypothetical protein
MVTMGTALFVEAGLKTAGAVSAVRCYHQFVVTTCSAAQDLSNFSHLP